MPAALPQAKVVFTREMLDGLKRAHNMALLKGAPTFMFEGNAYLVQYAEYLIEFLESEFAKLEAQVE